MAINLGFIFVSPFTFCFVYCRLDLCSLSSDVTRKFVILFTEPPDLKCDRWRDGHMTRDLSSDWSSGLGLSEMLSLISKSQVLCSHLTVKIFSLVINPFTNCQPLNYALSSDWSILDLEAKHFVLIG